jgi:signal transduction histidine kinase/AraC-like DNA-binding protein
LDERRVSFDALVAANDTMAVDALHELQRRGIRVPEDVAVTGFDDTQEAMSSYPPLTTVELPLNYEGRQGAEIILASLRGRVVSERNDFPTKMVIRQSCGCLSQAMSLVSAPAMALPGDTVDWQAHLDAQRPAGLAAMAEAFPAPSVWRLAPLWDAFTADLRSGGAEYPQTVENLIQQAIARLEDPAILQGVISAHRRVAQPFIAGRDLLARAENLWQKGRVLVAEASVQAQRSHKLTEDTLNARLRAVGQSLMTTFDRVHLMEVIANELPSLNIPACFVALYEEPGAPAAWARLVLAYENNRRIQLPADGLRFRAVDILPGEVFPRQRRFTFVLQPLYFQLDQIGYVLFEAGPRNGVIYETLRLQLSNALKGAGLVGEARQAQARAERADRLKSDFLALVSHELRTPLHLVVGMSEMMMLERDDRLALPPAYRADLNRIQQEAQHLDRLLRDVLDLATSQAGELRLAKTLVNLVKVFETVEAVGSQLTAAKGLGWRADIPLALPPVLGDFTRIRQIALNLVANAVKFTTQGMVSLAVEARRGEVEISVTDTGVGVPDSEKQTIFDEFRQSTRTSTRGFGGIGLGLAISKRLVEMHGGRIGVRDSARNAAGSTFYFTLPAATESGQPPHLFRERSQVVIVLVEAHADGAPLAEALTEQGFVVEILGVRETPDFIQDLLAAPPGGVVVGTGVENALGWEVMRALKENRATEEIPVILYSFAAGQTTGDMLELNVAHKPIAAAELARALEQQDLKGQRTVLIVDDEASLRDLHARIVRHTLPKARILEAANGEEALGLLSTRPVDLVLLDLMMPGIDGFGVLSAMHASESLRSIPVIVLTAQALTETVMDRLNRGVAAVLQKGMLTQAEVIAQIEAALGRSKRLGSETQRLARRAMSFIHEHYPEAITIERVAQYISVSTRHLNRAFKQEMGMTVMEYLKRYRVQRSKALLDAGTFSVTEVALAVGFNYSNHFTRVFHEEVGLSPSEYQRR